MSKSTSSTIEPTATVVEQVSPQAPPQKEAQKGIALEEKNRIVTSLLELISQSVPSGIALSDVVLSSSGYYYIRGLADDSSAVGRLTAALRKGSQEMKTESDQPIGASRRARSFARYGSIDPRSQQVPICADAAPTLAAAMEKIDGGLKQKGLKVQNPLPPQKGESLDQCEEYTVTRQVTGSFDALHALLRASKQNSIRAGVQRLTLTSDSQERMVAHLDIVIRVLPQRDTTIAP